MHLWSDKLEDLVMPMLSILTLLLLGALLLTIFVGRVSELTLMKLQQKRGNKASDRRLETKSVHTVP